MSRHRQQPTKKQMTCPNCMAGDCTKCVDTIRVKYAPQPTCEHVSKEHDKEVTALWRARQNKQAS